MLNYNCIIKEDHLDIRKTSEDVKLPLTNEDRNTLLDMYEYLINGYDEELAKKLNIRPGVGIAAPQIDVLKKMFVIVAYDEHDELHEYGVINPKIISHSEELTYLETGEGCLSVCDIHKGYIHRYKKIKVRSYIYDFLKGTFTQDVMELKGYLAVVFQHEYDHLFGTLFYDRINKENPFYIPNNSHPVKFKEN